jgi:hypothetical protein
MDKGKIERIQRNQANYGEKKHVGQMTELEKDFLMRKFRAVKQQDWCFTPYSLKRFNKREVDPTHFLSLWEKDVQLIEFHSKKGTNRILLRSKAVHNGYQICAVFDLTNKVIITLYLNYVNNTHRGLREEFYNADVDVLALFQGGQA